MGQDVLWMGFVNQLEALRVEILFSHDRDVDRAIDAQIGLEKALQKEYPLILVNEILPHSGVVLPEGMHPEDVVRIGCHVVREVRSKGPNTKTHIMLTYFGDFPGYDKGTALRMYREAGVTEAFNISGGTLTSFAEAVGKYLGASSAPRTPA